MTKETNNDTCNKSSQQTPLILSLPNNSQPNITNLFYQHTKASDPTANMAANTPLLVNATYDDLNLLLQNIMQTYKEERAKDKEERETYKKELETFQAYMYQLRHHQQQWYRHPCIPSEGAHHQQWYQHLCITSEGATWSHSPSHHSAEIQPFSTHRLTYQTGTDVPIHPHFATSTTTTTFDPTYRRPSPDNTSCPPLPASHHLDQWSTVCSPSDRMAQIPTTTNISCGSQSCHR